MSLRIRLILGAVLIALVLGLAAVTIARTTERQLVEQVDTQLRGASARAAAPPRRPAQNAGTGDRLSSLYVGFVDRDGILQTAFAPNLATDNGPIPVVNATDIAAMADGDVITVPSRDSAVEYRALARDSPNGTTVILALPLDGVADAVQQLIVVELLAGIAVILVLALVTAWVIQLGVRPVQRMTETASAIAAGDLSQRVPEGNPGSEAGELGIALNEMLSRIEEAFEQRRASEDRLRQFVADASHELRTPVTTIRGFAELYRTGGLPQSSDIDEAMRRTEQEAIRMGSLVDDLLHLARLDQGRPLGHQPVELSQLAHDVVHDALAMHPNRTITVIAPEAVTVTGDEARLRQVVSNLVTNAVLHAPDAAIEVRIHAIPTGAEIEVADDGPGMSDGDAARVFERFYRADASRVRQQGGSGLGLAIVEATVRAHGGDVSLTTTLGQGTTVRVELPHQPPVAQHRLDAD
ncbi:MAG: HAMP domain-containing histidine kinase [Acidimicrobiia bacterium]|nr:HAMP domain-containing histidine kinase [Acidimicrobiia bacterium]